MTSKSYDQNLCANLKKKLSLVFENLWGENICHQYEDIIVHNTVPFNFIRYVLDLYIHIMELNYWKWYVMGEAVSSSTQLPAQTLCLCYYNIQEFLFRTFGLKFLRGQDM